MHNVSQSKLFENCKGFFNKKPRIIVRLKFKKLLVLQEEKRNFRHFCDTFQCLNDINLNPNRIFVRTIAKTT